MKMLDRLVFLFLLGLVSMINIRAMRLVCTTVSPDYFLLYMLSLWQFNMVICTIC